MTTNHYLKYFELLPPTLRAKSVIAGGAAVDITKANDVDLWVFVPPLGEGMLIADQDALVNSIVDHLLHLGYRMRWTPVTELTTGPWIEFAGLKRGYILGDDKIERVMTIHTPGMLPTQIMFTTYGDVYKLLTAFDITTHMVAVTENGAVITVSQTTSPAEPPKVSDHVNARTPNRLKKILARYCHDSSDENVAKIMGAAGWVLGPDPDYLPLVGTINDSVWHKADGRRLPPPTDSEGA